MSKNLTPEAYGVLQALVSLGTIRLFEPLVEQELIGLRYVKLTKGRLAITEKGCEAAQEYRKHEIKRIRKHKKPRYLSG